MKAVTANLLADGRVVYLAADGSWAERLAGAAIFEDDAAAHALTAAQARAIEIADAYLIEAEAGGAPAGREAFREAIRNCGPTVRPDLGKQAGSA